ncbi:MAG: hypothetical protein JW849_10610 [Phycisphaerae bacterium]|nr:hypothetical protein [Phycisphaerae bacterium]
MYKNLILLILFVLLLSAAVWFGSLPGRAQQSPPPDASWTPTTPVKTGEFRGISLQLDAPHLDHPYETFISEIARTGANTINLVVHGYQENVKSTSIFLDNRKVPSDEHLERLIRFARKKKLRVMLMPVVLLARRSGSDWRGKIAPDDWDQWWEDYTQFILRYANLAGRSGVEVFSVGSELISTETHTARWKELIAKVRQAFPGRLTYSANWDHYEAPKFWSDLDIVGMTTYFTLAKGTEPKLQEMLDSWGNIKGDILRWQKTVNRPILFTEVGWPNQVTAAEFPWNYYASPNKPDPQQQADCFESFFRTWSREQAVAGFLVWEWRNFPDQPTDPQTDTSYRPVGKPAMRVVQKYLLAPDAFAETQPAPAGQPVSLSR